MPTSAPPSPPPSSSVSPSAAPPPRTARRSFMRDMGESMRNSDNPLIKFAVTYPGVVKDTVGVLFVAEELVTGFAGLGIAGGIFEWVLSRVSGGIVNAMTNHLPTTATAISSLAIGKTVKDKMSTGQDWKSGGVWGAGAFVVAFEPLRRGFNAMAEKVETIANNGVPTIPAENPLFNVDSIDSFVQAVQNNPMAATELGAAIVSAGWLAKTFAKSAGKKALGFVAALPVTYAAMGYAIPDAYARAATLVSDPVAQGSEYGAGMAGAALVGTGLRKVFNAMRSQPASHEKRMMTTLTTAATSVFYLHRPLNHASQALGGWAIEKGTDLFYKVINMVM